MKPVKSFWVVFSGILLWSGGLLALTLLGLAAGATGLQAAPAATWYADAAGGNDGNDCQTAGTACATIGAAIGKAAGGDTIQIAAGTYLESGLRITESLTLQGAGADVTILDANFITRALRVGAPSTIADLTIQNGLITATSGSIDDLAGAGILAIGDLLLRDAIVVNNSTSGVGGGIFNNGDLTIENSQILSNTSSGHGAGLYNYTAGVITMTDSVVGGNETASAFGGGIYSFKSLTLNRVTIRDNSAVTAAGGIHNGGTADLDAVTLTGNEAAVGPAYYSSAGTADFTNVTVSENTASSNYGGIYLTGASTALTLTNSTIANNHRTGSVGPGNNGLLVTNNATVTLLNTIVAGNDEENCGGTTGTFISAGYNLADDATCGLNAAGDAEGVDPLLAALADYGGGTLTHALLAGSPAIDSGTNAGCPAVDQRGVARPVDGDSDGTATCDKGAYEVRSQLAIADVSIWEGDAGSTAAVFTVTLSPTSTQTVTVSVTTADGTAEAGSDYTAVSQTLTFNPGQATRLVSVDILGDTDDESDESFSVLLSSPVNADLLDGVGLGTIVDDDGLPGLTINDANVLEGNSGSVTALFTVTLSPAAAGPVTVTYGTAAGTAAAGADFTPAGGTLTFNPGQTSRPISVTVLGDIIDEGSSETFTVTLSAPINAKIVDGEGIGTITDDDTARLEHKLGPSVLEGNAGTSPATFTVTLSTPAAFVITVDYAVSSGFGAAGAVIGEDFLSTPGTLTFQPGETTKNYTVDVIGDTDIEPDERFTSLISNGSAPISVNGSSGMILNDDQPAVFLPTIIR